MLYFMDLALRGKIAHVPNPLTGRRVHATNQSGNPRAPVEWHKALEMWFQQLPDLASHLETVRDYWLDLISAQAWKLKAARNWPDYWYVRRHLQQFSAHPSAALVLANRIYQPWIYTLRDWITAWLSRTPPCSPRCDSISRRQ